MGLGEQAKVLTETQIDRVLAEVAASERETAMVLLSVRAGLRAKEIANLTRTMLCDVEGRIGDDVRLENAASKGRSGRPVPICKQLRKALVELHDEAKPNIGGRVIVNSNGRAMTANSVTVWFHRLYNGLGFHGASSHSGRRTAITRWARQIVSCGGSLKEVQELAGHSSLSVTQRYIDSSADAKRKVVERLSREPGQSLRLFAEVDSGVN
jgi:integrase/recombinase XerC